MSTVVRMSWNCVAQKKLARDQAGTNGKCVNMAMLLTKSDQEDLQEFCS